MARNPNSQITITLVDSSRETSGFTVNTPTGYNLDELTAAELTAVDNLRNALNVLSLMVPIRESSTVSRKISNQAVGDGNREDKILVIYEDTVTFALYSAEIPGRDPALSTAKIFGTDEYDLTNPTIAQFVSAFEGIARSNDGNPVNVLSMSLVGRNI